MIVEISTHTLTWSVTNFFRPRFHKDNHFNSHAHVERDRYLFYILEYEMDFNSHAHVERDTVITRLYPLGAISTHTLTWSVTTAETICTL